MRRVGVGAEKSAEKTALEEELANKIEKLKKDNAQLKAENKELKSKIKDLEKSGEE